MHPDLVADAAGREHAEAFMKRLNSAYAKGDAEAIGNLVRQWETSPYARGTAGRRRPRAGARTPRSRTPSSGWPRRATPTSRG